MLPFIGPDAAAIAARLNEEDANARYVKMLVVPALVLAAGCGRNDKPMDDALKNDLAWRRRCSRINRSSSCRRWSRATRAYGYGQYAPQPQTGTTPARRSRSRSAGSTARRPHARVALVERGLTAHDRDAVVKNTKRDAIIGGVAGAAIGAVTTRDKLKGAVIGGVAGSVLGAVIGNNVDVKKIPF